VPGPSPRRVVRIFLIAILIVGVNLILFESAARILLSIDDFFIFIAKGNGSSSAARLIWHVKHGNQGGFLPYTFYQFHPVRGWTLKKNLREVPATRGSTINSNSRGLRGVNEYPYERKTGKRRILLVGDLFTFGEDVSDLETFRYHLEKGLKNTEIINLAMSGYGHDQMLIFLKEEGLKYKPDLVILGFVFEDIWRNTQTFSSYAKPKYELINGTLKMEPLKVVPPARLKELEPFRMKSLDILDMTRYWYFKKKGTFEKNAYAYGFHFSGNDFDH